MRVLVTGILPINAKNGRRRVQRWVQGDCLEKLATLCGYEVERRPVDPEDPGTWDVAFVALAVPNALGAMYAAGALSILGRRGVVPHFDYWDVQRTMNGVLALRAPGKAAGLARIPGTKHPEWIKEHAGKIEGAAAMMKDGIKDALAPLFPWGDHSRLHALMPQVKRLHWLDFSAAEPHYLGDGYEPKWSGRERAWVWALHNGWMPSEDLPPTSWKWRLIGRAADRKAPLFPESRVCEVYADSWGVRVSPNKDRRGDGWFKNTYVFAARAGALLWLSEEDAAGTGYDVVAGRASRRGIERGDEEDLAAMAQYQREWFFDHSWNLPKLKERFRRLCERMADDG